MGDVVDFPTNPEMEEAIQEAMFTQLVYKWWMLDFFPMFEEAGKIKHAFFVYSEYYDVMCQLRDMDAAQVLEDEDGTVGLAIEPETRSLIMETMIDAFNQSKYDEDPTEEQLH